MDRTDLIAATAILLFAAFGLGFLTHWLVARLSHVSRHDLDEFDRMAEALHHAEEQRDASRARRKVAEAQLADVAADLEAALAALEESRAEADELRAFIAAENLGQR